MSMEILEHEDSLHGHRLHVRQRLHRIGSVIDGGLWSGGGVEAGRLEATSGPLWTERSPVPTVLLLERTNPSAIVHSKMAMFNSEQAARTSETARTSSTVSITTIGVDELMSTLRRSSGLHIYF